VKGKISVLEKSRPLISIQDFSRSEIISFIKNKLSKKDIISCFLFGSSASGDTNPWSDLDILIIAETEKPFIERPLKYQELFELGVSLDIVVYTPYEFEKVKKSNSGFGRDIQKNMIKVL
jgi:uncharacterized protein